MSPDLIRYSLARAETPDDPALALPNAALYRRMVRATIGTVVDNAFPVAREILRARGASLPSPSPDASVPLCARELSAQPLDSTAEPPGADPDENHLGPARSAIPYRLPGEDGFSALVAAFIEAGGPSTSFYRDVPGDLVTFAQASAHPLADLLHYEWLELLAAHDPSDLDGLAPPRDDAVHLNPTLQFGVYRRPVHLMSAAEPDPAPLSEPVVYLVWRRPATDEVVFHRASLLLGRALADAMLRPAPLAELAARLFAETEGAVSTEAITEALEALVEALRARDGVMSRARTSRSPA